MKVGKIIIKIVNLIIVFLCITVSVFADVGGFQRYDSGSSGSSSSSSSDSSSIRSSRDLLSSSVESSYDSSIKKTSSSSKSFSDLSIGDKIIVVAVPIGAFIYPISMLIILRIFIKKSRNKSVNYINTQQFVNNTKIVEKQIRQIDPLFSSERFLETSKELFVKLQSAWTKREWQEIRPFESDELFAQHNAQLQDLINSGKINVVERVTVTDAALYKFMQDGDKELLTITLKAVMRDYIIDEKTKQVLEGNKDKDMYMTYRLTFMRKTGVKTKETTNNTISCPNCGALVQITTSGQCEFCGSVITTGEHDWVLSSLQGI